MLKWTKPVCDSQLEKIKIFLLSVRNVFFYKTLTVCIISKTKQKLERCINFERKEWSWSKKAEGTPI